MPKSNYLNTQDIYIVDFVDVKIFDKNHELGRAHSLTNLVAKYMVRLYSWKMRSEKSQRIFVFGINEKTLHGICRRLIRDLSNENIYIYFIAYSITCTCST